MRHGGYSCSNDEGATWHTIKGLPRAGYQPCITELSDARLLCAGHVGGGDVAFGKNDLYIETHTFRLETNIPQPTKLFLVREKDKDGSRYVNSFLATLTVGDRPVPGQTIRFRYKVNRNDDWLREDLTATTDQNGQARLDLIADVLVVERKRPRAYWLKASFEPPEGVRWAMIDGFRAGPK